MALDFGIDPSAPPKELWTQSRSPYNSWWMTRSAQAAVICTPMIAAVIIGIIRGFGFPIEWWKFAGGVVLGIAVGLATNAGLGIFIGIAIGVAGGVARGGVGLDVAVGSAIGVLCAACSTLFGAKLRPILLGAAALLLCIAANEIVFGNGVVYAQTAGIAFVTTLAVRTWERLLPPRKLLKR